MELLAPNGQASNLTPKQYKLVRTPAFKEWFGDWENDPANSSKIVDKNGEPLVVYHGSNMLFNEFSNKFNSIMSGFYFSNNIENAKTYGDILSSFFLSIKKPLVIDAKGVLFTEDLSVKVLAKYPNEKQYETNLGIDLDEIVYMTKKGKRPNSFIEIKNHKNYDGNIFNNLIDPSLSSIKKIIQNTIVAFEPNQIKLADGSNTTFDGSNPDILFDGGGQVQDLISQGVVELKMFDTKPEHAKEYGFDVKKPLYIQSICIQENERLKGIGKKVFQHIDEYAIKNGHDLIFGHITQKENFTKDSRQTNLCDIDLIKEFLIKSGYKTIEGNNDFYKLIKINPDIRFDDGGSIKSNIEKMSYELLRLNYDNQQKGEYRNFSREQFDDLINGLKKNIGYNPIPRCNFNCITANTSDGNISIDYGSDNHVLLFNEIGEPKGYLVFEPYKYDKRIRTKLPDYFEIKFIYSFYKGSGFGTKTLKNIIRLSHKYNTNLLLESAQQLINWRIDGIGTPIVPQDALD